MLRNFTVTLLLPKVFLVVSIVSIIFGISLSVYNSNIGYWGIFSSFSGLLGIVLASRKIIRKGCNQLIHEERHIDYGGLGTSAEEINENLQVDIDAEATYIGGTIVSISAICVFITEIIRFYESI